METKETRPILQEIKNGWAAIGNGWAVHGKTADEAQHLYNEAEKIHSIIDARAPKKIELG
jgi:hypothetical protein